MTSIDKKNVMHGAPAEPKSNLVLNQKEAEEVAPLSSDDHHAAQLPNPLLAAIERFLLARNGAVSEHEIIKFCEREALFDKIFSKDSNPYLLDLFTKHFFVMNALYVLREQFYSDGIGDLAISATRIELSVLNSSPSSKVKNSVNAQPESTALRDYYLDLNNLKGESEHSINELLGSFWKKYARFVDSNEGEQALAIFDLELPSTLKALRLAYKRKIHNAHPDRGGSAEDFKALQIAYDSAKNFLQSRC